MCKCENVEIWKWFSDSQIAQEEQKLIIFTFPHFHIYYGSFNKKRSLRRRKA